MKKILLINILILALYQVSFSQFHIDRPKYHRKILSVNTSIINSTYSTNQSIFNNLELSAYTPLTFSRIFRNQLYGFGVGSYFANYTKEDNIYFVKASVDFVFSETSNFSAGLFFDYLFVKNKINTGIRFQYPLRLYTLNKHSFDIEVRTEIAYNTYLSKWILGLSLGINMNKITQGSYRKPVLYIYPKDTIDLKVNLNFKGDFTFTWPEYNEGWDLIVYPNSEIKNKADNKMYNYLFWEGDYNVPNKDTIKSGFIVENKKLPYFFEAKLREIGLNSKEINDFITYWVPLLNKDEYFIHFLTNKECEIVATYSFSNEPESFIRLITLFMEVPNDKENIIIQELINNKRKGFTIIEWGGVEL